MIIPIYDHKPKKYKISPKPVNRFATANCNRRHFIDEGETVYILTMQGNEVRLNKTDDQGNPIPDNIYIDEKKNYI